MSKATTIGCSFSKPRRVPAALLAAGFVAGLTLGTAGVAFGDAGGPASCIGHEASGISPPGSSPEFAGGMPELLPFVRESFPGVPPGAVVSSIAHVHAGSHDACDEAG